MTAEDIRQQTDMRDIVRRYGFQPNRSGFICCPFHGERTPSMKIYKDHAYCYGCHQSFDCFSFVMKMENCDFRTAFHRLGGSGRRSDLDHLRIYKQRSKANRKAEQVEQARQKYREAIDRLKETKEAQPDGEPFSDGWCEGLNRIIEERALAEKAADIALSHLLDLEGRLSS